MEGARGRPRAKFGGVEIFGLLRMPQDDNVWCVRRQRGVVEENARWGSATRQEMVFTSEIASLRMTNGGRG